MLVSKPGRISTRKKWRSDIYFSINSKSFAIVKNFRKIKGLVGSKKKERKKVSQS